MSGVSESRVWRMREYCVIRAFSRLTSSAATSTCLGLRQSARRDLNLSVRVMPDLCFKKDYFCGCVQNQLGMGMAMFGVHGGIAVGGFKIMVTWIRV